MQDIEENRSALVNLALGPYLLVKFPFSLRQAAAIVSDDVEPVSFRTVKAWTTGQVLPIKPTLKVEGRNRPVFGFHDLFKLLIAKKLLRGPSALPSFAVRAFIECWQKPRFLKHDFNARMKGTFVLYQTSATAIEIDFVPEGEDLTAALQKAVKAKTGAIRVIGMAEILEELKLRVCCWAMDEKFPAKKPLTKEEWVELFQSTGNLIRRVNECEPTMK
jgi:hypothetical protein